MLNFRYDKLNQTYPIAINSNLDFPLSMIWLFIDSQALAFLGFGLFHSTSIQCSRWVWLSLYSFGFLQWWLYSYIIHYLFHLQSSSWVWYYWLYVPKPWWSRLFTSKLYLGNKYCWSQLSWEYFYQSELY